MVHSEIRPFPIGVDPCTTNASSRRGAAPVFERAECSAGGPHVVVRIPTNTALQTMVGSPEMMKTARIVSLGCLQVESARERSATTVGSVLTPGGQPQDLALALVSLSAVVRPLGAKPGGPEVNVEALLAPGAGHHPLQNVADQPWEVAFHIHDQCFQGWERLSRGLPEWGVDAACANLCVSTEGIIRKATIVVGGPLVLPTRLTCLEELLVGLPGSWDAVRPVMGPQGWQPTPQDVPEGHPPVVQALVRKVLLQAMGSGSTLSA